MDFNFNNFSLSNLQIGDFNAVNFSIAGMVIVFFGLSFIALYIILLPKILHLNGNNKSNISAKKKSKEGVIAARETELLIAIATALHLDQFQNGFEQKITWQRHGQPDSPWQTAGRIRSVSVRSHLPRRR